MPKRGENIYKRKDGRWEGRYIRLYGENGKPKYGYVYAKTYKEAKAQLQIQKSNCLAAKPPAAKTITYSELLQYWLQSTRMHTKESTYARYVELVQKHIEPFIGKYQVSLISTQLLSGFIEQKLQDGRLDHKGGLAPKTVSDILTVIKSTFKYAKREDVPVACDPDILSVKKKEKEMRVLSREEQDALVRVLREDMDCRKFGVLLALYTGIRIGELCALQWEDIDFVHSILKIRKTMQRIRDTNLRACTKTKVIITEPKSKCSMRDIPLPPFLLDFAKEFQAEPKAYILSGVRFKWVEPRVLQNSFCQYVKESRIAPANFHALRHTFATRCVELGFELKSLSEILGHSSVNITLNRYVHSSMELKYVNMNKLSLS